MMKKILTVGALAALLSGVNAEAIRFDQIKQKAVRSSLVQTGLKAGMDELQAAGVPVWSYFKSEKDFLPLIKAKKQGKDPLAVYWAQIDKNATREEKERMLPGGPAAAAADALGMDRYAGKIKAENYPYLLGKFADAMEIKRGPDLSKRAKGFLRKAKNNNAFASAYEIKDPYELNRLYAGNLRQGFWIKKIISNDRLIQYFNTQVLPADAIANVGPGSSSAQFQNAIKQVFYVMHMHNQNIRQDGSMVGGTRESRAILFTVTGVNDQGYRVSFVNLRGRFQHAFVPFLGAMQGQYKPLKIGQLLVAKINYGVNRQLQNLDFPGNDNLQGEINGNQFDINPNIPAGAQENYRLTLLPIIKGLVPVR
ncbi:MAG: hypothetical protein CMM87_02435 [Rickettsiales bacterium]|nr:hypothetical protein [Rickettsiales bacterium]|tara:strand:+ start:920 stop:2017 length:1098 start_codon:yes stop_codon:yes gene_type:complete